MSKNKFDFIKRILDDKNIGVTQREKILELAANEIKFEGNIEERVQKIEEILFNYRVSGDTDSSKQKYLESKLNYQPRFIHPYHLYRFLFQYNQNPILRTTCHESDSDSIESIKDFCNTEEYSFPKHLEKVLEVYQAHENDFPATRNIRAMIKGYLTGKDAEGKPLRKGWSSMCICINWSSQELTDWTSKIENIPPNFNESLAGEQEIELYQINPQILSAISNEPIQNFTQLTLHFKNLFHIKSGEQSLRSILLRVNLFKQWDERIDFDFSSDMFQLNLEHFTDVDSLISAYNRLIQLILEQHRGGEKPKVKLEFYEENNSVWLTILHINSKYNKDLKSTLSRPIGDFYAKLIEKQINGLCNLYLRADFNGEFAELNLWNGLEIQEKRVSDFEGVQHLLEFPKNHNL
jgi:hypothetical protein